MPRKKSYKLFLLVLGGLLATIWFFSLRPIESPYGKIIWSLAIARGHKTGRSEKMPVLYAATNGAVFISPDWGKTWNKKAVGRVGFPFITLTANADGDLAGGTLDGELYFYRSSSDRWANFKVSDYPITSIEIRDYGTTFLVGTFGNGVFIVTDSFGSWSKVAGDLADSNVWCMTRDGTFGDLALTSSGGYSSDKFLNDDRQWMNVSGPTSATACASDWHGHLFARDTKGRLVVSEDDGKTASTVVGLNGIWLLAADKEGDVVVGSEFGPYWSQDGGKNWVLIVSLRETVASTGLIPPVWAQQIGPPIDVRSSGQIGPPILTPIREPLGGSNSGLRMPSGQIGIPGLPTGAADSQARNNGSVVANGSGGTDGQQTSFDGERKNGEEPPPTPHSEPRVRVLAGLVCSQESDGGIRCPGADVRNYVRSVLQAKDIADMVGNLLGEKFFYGNSMTENLIDDAIQREINELTQQAINRMETTVEEDLQRITAISNAPPDLISEARAHGACVQRIRDQAIRESTEGTASGIGRLDGSDRRSRMTYNTSGPALHQLSYSAVHGVGWW